jgi:hypothetical protein
MCQLHSENGHYRALALDGSVGMEEPRGGKMSRRLPPYDVGADACCYATPADDCSTAENRCQ